MCVLPLPVLGLRSAKAQDHGSVALCQDCDPVPPTAQPGQGPHPCPCVQDPTPVCPCVRVCLSCRAAAAAAQSCLWGPAPSPLQNQESGAKDKLHPPMAQSGSVTD